MVIHPNLFCASNPWAVRPGKGLSYHRKRYATTLFFSCAHRNFLWSHPATLHTGMAPPFFWTMCTRQKNERSIPDLYPYRSIILGCHSLPWTKRSLEPADSVKSKGWGQLFFFFGGYVLADKSGSNSVCCGGTMEGFEFKHCEWIN